MMEAIIFDLDGLMIDSEPMAHQAWSRVLQDYGYRLDNQTFGRMIGLRLEDSSRMVKAAFDMDASPEELANLEQNYMNQIMSQGIPTMPGLMILLNEIEQRALPWAVATSSTRSYAVRVLEQLGLGKSLQALAAGNEVKNGKPAPDVYILAAERMTANPVRCLALEDSVPGIQSAKAAGMRAVAVPNGETSPMEFDDADFVYKSLGEVATDLDRLLELS
jgi:HAD superfamily hydrolase (TIGR01509 family)